jgi:hypothetical protein
MVWFDNLFVLADQSAAGGFVGGQAKPEELITLLDFTAPGAYVYVTNSTLSGGCGFSNGVKMIDGRFLSAGALLLPTTPTMVP